MGFSIENTFGLVDIVCSIACFWPQIIKSIRTKSVDDLSIMLCILSVIGYFAAIGYAIMKFGFDLLLCTNYSLSCASVIILMVVYYKYRK